ncbi:MAG: glycosyltransferase family 2 protein, partial [Pseudomonas sp.]
MNEQSLVSIVIPAYNPRFFSMTLQSALTQTHEHLEVLVCDDSEGDEIEGVVRSLEALSGRPVRYMRNPRRLGFVANVVHAVEMASGQWVKVLCDDDRLLPLCVARQVQVFDKHPEVSLVLAQRMFADENNYVLPMRLANARFAGVDSVFHGDDVLSVLADNPVNFVGNLSAAMMRRDQALKYLNALTEDEHGFAALLDMALFCCLMRSGPLAMVSDVLLIERLHAERLSKQPAIQASLTREWGWLQQMLQQRGGEAAPAHGWVRHRPLRDSAEAAGTWKEMNLVLLLGNWQNTMHRRIGSDCESYDELYQQWLEERQLSSSQLKRLPQTVESWSRHPPITVIVLDQGGSFDDVSATLQSVKDQVYGAHELVLLSNREGCASAGITQYALSDNWAAQLNDWLVLQPEARWFYVLQAGDRLVQSALLLLAERIAVLPGLACIYSDEDAWGDGKPCEPIFKPDFNIDLMRSYPYVGRTLAFECAAVRAVGGFDAGFDQLAAHDVLWRLVETRGPQSIEHIAEIQVHSALGFAQWLSGDEVIAQSEQIASAHLNRLGIAHQVRHDDMPLLNRIDYQRAGQASVTLVVPCNQCLDVVQRCVMSVMERTDYPNYELVLVAAERVEPALGNWLDAMAEVGGAMLRVLRLADADDAASMINQAAAIARGEYLLMLASGLEVCDGQWLNEMLNHAQRPEVAIVGAKVLDVFGKVVHAGLVLGGNGAAGPVCVGDDGDSRGYLQRLQVVQNWTAVSGDCLVVRKQVFDDLGGLDIAQFSMGLGEVDLCLRARRQGYLVVWTPHATLRMIGAAPAQVPAEHAVAQQSAFFDRWLQVVVRDPAYNPNLGLGRINFSLDPSLQGSWDPFCARTLPSVLALPINASAVGGYRVNEPFSRLQAAGRIVGRLAYEVPSPVQLVRMDPDIIVVQLRHTEEAVRDIERLAKYSSARRVFEIDDYVLQAPKKNSHARNKPKDIEQHLRKGISLCDRV